MTDRPSIPAPPAAALDAIRRAVGPKGVIEGADRAPYLSEWRARWPGEAALIVAPASTQEVAKVVSICAAHGVAITPQGGNTGLVGGQIPYGNEILLSLRRMRTIRDVSPLDNTMTLDAGVALAEAQQAAREAGRLFPLSIGSEGSCQIGGVVSTNAGGVNVLRYGNMRDLVLGLEAVLPDGRVWNGLKRLRKDNTGYDLKQLFIGGEGTLGIVTSVVVKLFPLPRETVTVFAGVPDPAAAVALLSHAQDETGGLVSSFELMGRLCLDLVLRHIPDTRDPLGAPHPWHVLMAFSSSGGGLRARVEALLESALEKGLLADAAIAQNEREGADFWRLRHTISEALNHEGLGARHDVSVPTADIPAFLEAAGAEVASLAPGARVAAFGHIGDGNVHYDVVPPDGAAPDALDGLRPQIEERVYDVIARMGGSISAEHGVGRHRRAAIAKRKSAVELDMMRAIKKALDPQGIMNPGKML
ncbi:FAD-binding oxidoreductase [Amphiplicatus metriothermophilus]|uniref:FAD/FMN-containing dehydrogenase n=1 Tax=Amphiplicatus metriothermophilus TaxID=1519374 RepID=A0A239PKJ0_9PROT|nr:FAD-binding oxidoreductase [Amphiplicatus metriothermophilus]MBB5518102.1 FAD/FMN-containing dehydrogenase [Amphiplicatus metriothermophilus]SNT67564.1 FAD/FMN-containing dehydrogenase [Amphiplicatus metriothermophilus]